MVTLSLNASSEEQYPDEPLIVILTIFFLLIHSLFGTLCNINFRYNTILAEVY